MTLMTFQPTSVPESAKWAFTTRRVTRADVAGIDFDISQAISGDIVLGQVLAIGQHKNIQLPEGRAAQIYPGDYVVLVCGDRYAPDQFEALAELDPEGADMVAGGGVIGRMRAAHAKMAAPTRVKPIGLPIDAGGEVINIARYAIPSKRPFTDMPVIGVVGASMNAGKTTAVASLAHGLTRAGYSVAAIKVTGTGAFGDYNAYVDAGAHTVADFTDAGMVSTYLQPIDRIEAGFETLLGHACERGATVAVAELADGVFQLETAELLRASTFRDALSGILFAAPDAIGSVGGVEFLRRIGLEPGAVSGMVSCSPLAIGEAEAVIGVPVASRADLCDPAYAGRLLSRMVTQGIKAAEPKYRSAA